MDIINQLSPVQVTILGVVVAGIVELYGRIVTKDFRVVGKIIVAVITGTLIGLSYGLEFVSALAVGFVAPGGISIVGSFGNKSAAHPSNLIEK